MKQVFKCEYCEEISENKTEIEEHEKQCGYNPKNEIDNKTILKLSGIPESVEDAIIYVLLADYKKDLNYFFDEFDRATSRNCVASIYKKKSYIKGIISRAKGIEKEEFKWFMNITQRDKPEFIEAIRTYIKEPEFRV